MRFRTGPCEFVKGRAIGSLYRLRSVPGHPGAPGSLAITAGAIPSNLVTAYRALGGGWQIREGHGFLPPQTVAAMSQRTDWGKLLDYEIAVPPVPMPRPTEFRLLEFLMRRAETIVSRTQLADHVWGNDYDPFSNVADVYIGYLRRKLTAAGIQGTLIQTIRGLGYMLKRPALCSRENCTVEYSAHHFNFAFRSFMSHRIFKILSHHDHSATRSTQSFVCSCCYDMTIRKRIV